MKQNWFNTLNDALESEGLIDRWRFGDNIQYNQTFGVVSGGIYITIYRDERGMYERPIHYETLMEDGYSYVYNHC